MYAGNSFSGRYRKLDKRPAGEKETFVYQAAFLIPRKGAKRLALIAVDLPTAAAFAVPAGVFYESDDIIQRISQKNADFVRKFGACLYPPLKQKKRLVIGKPVIAVRREKCLNTLIGKQTAKQRSANSSLRFVYRLPSDSDSCSTD